MPVINARILSKRPRVSDGGSRGHFSGYMIAVMFSYIDALNCDKNWRYYVLLRNSLGFATIEARSLMYESQIN